MKRRMHYFILLVSCFLLANTVFAHEAAKEETDQFKGIWQYCPSFRKAADGSLEGIPGNIFKIFTADGEMTTFQFHPQKGEALITGLGTYEVTSDTTYVECIDKSSNPTVVGKKNLMKFHFDGKFMYIRFYLEKWADGSPCESWQEEVWMRVNDVATPAEATASK